MVLILSDFEATPLPGPPDAEAPAHPMAQREAERRQVAIAPDQPEIHVVLGLIVTRWRGRVHRSVKAPASGAQWRLGFTGR